jgi:hypothetical protein
LSKKVICFDENPQRQNVEEDRRGYGGRFEESDCGSEAWEELESEKAKGRKKEATGHTQKFAEAESGEAKEKAAEKVGEKIGGRDRFEESDCGDAGD